MKEIQIFDYDYYYENHKDVLRVGMDGLDHFIRYGRFEGRAYRSDIDLPRAVESFTERHGEYERGGFIDFVTEFVSRSAKPLDEGESVRQALDEIVARAARPCIAAADLVAKGLSPSVNMYRFINSESSRPRVSMVVPTLNDSGIYGGIRTALDFFLWLVESLSDNVDFRIISQNDAIYGDIVKNDLVARGFQISDPHDEKGKVIVSGEDRDRSVFSLREKDLFVTTFWATAVSVQSGLDAVGSAARICHFLQDYEPNFYAANSLQQMCLSSLRHARNALYIANSDHLSEFIGRTCSLSAPCVPFTPRINPNLLPVGDQKRSDVVLFYARKNPRNLFDIGKLAIARFHEIYPDLAARFQYIGIGDISGSYVVGPDSMLHCVGRLSLAQYRAWMGRARVGVSLMMAPHPSYPPLEMAYNGLRVVTNDYGTKRMSGVHANIVSADEPTPEKICDLLYKQCMESTQSPPLVAEPFREQLEGFELMDNPFQHLLENDAFREMFGDLL